MRLRISGITNMSASPQRNFRATNQIVPIMPNIQHTIVTFIEDIATFTSGLPELQPSDLPDGDSPCPICMEPFFSDASPEPPVSLPGGHIYVRRCLKKWCLSSLGETPTTCPMCSCWDSAQDGRISSGGQLDGCAQERCENSAPAGDAAVAF